MREWPEALRAMFPAAPGVYALRPWWRALQSDVLTSSPFPRLGSIRVADRKIVEWTAGILAPVASMPKDELREKSTEISRLVAEYDHAHPLPFPGIRPGQIWAWEAANDAGAPMIATLTVLRQARDARGTWHTDRTALYGTSEDLTETTLSGCYLVTDLACPHLAPWAPFEEVPRAS